MPMPPERRVHDLLRKVSLRLRWQAAARVTGVAAMLALLPFLLTHRILPSAVIAGVSAAAGLWITRRTHQHPAARIEARVPECRNVLVTAEALIERRLFAKPEVAAVVMADAANRAETIVPADLWPWLRPALALGAATTIWVAAVLTPMEWWGRLLPGPVAASSAPIVTHVDVFVSPPDYTGRTAETFRNPERITALAGSRAQVSVASTAAAITIETESGVSRATRTDAGSFTAEVTVTTDGYLAITPLSTDGEAGARRLIGVTALPDRAPEVRITEPGKDLFLRSSATHPLAVRIQAEDDLGLRSVTLAYTKVAGAGESFTFTEGEAPVTITRTSERQWVAAGALPLDALGLEIGDMVVYRAVALDQRPRTAPVESDAFIVEIVSASDAMAEGFSIDERQDKYALSQQMIIIKTERLLARAPAVSRDTVVDEAMGLAAEQRSVRAEIVFMMGGEFEDELVEAGQETEIIEGRTDNSGRADLGRATRAMSRAAAQLTDLDLKTALATERAALVAMQRALSRRRFILRTLTQRGQIDDARRLQGRLTDLGRGHRIVDASSVDALVTAARAALRVVADVSRQPVLDRRHATVLSDAAARLLTTEGRGAPVVDVAARLNAAAEAISAEAPDAARRALADATTRLTAMVSGELPIAPLIGRDPSLARLRGALADALRTGGGR